MLYNVLVLAIAKLHAHHGIHIMELSLLLGVKEVIDPKAVHFLSDSVIHLWVSHHEVECGGESAC